MDLISPTLWLDLPLEIRVLVYTHYFRTKRIYIHPHHIDDWLLECYSSEDEGEVVNTGHPRIKYSNGTIPLCSHSSLRILQVEPLALLYTSKLVRREAEPIFWSETRFQFENRSTHYINDPKLPVDLRIMHLQVHNDDSYGDTLEDWLTRRFEPSSMWMDELSVTGSPLTQSTSETLLSLLFRLGRTQIGELSFSVEGPRYQGTKTWGRLHYTRSISRVGRIMLGKARRGSIHAPTQAIADFIVKEIEEGLGSRLPLELDWVPDDGI